MHYFIHLEPLDKRYTAQWANWIPAACEDLEIEATHIWGDQLTDYIETGDVLDVYGTHHWKFSQLMQLNKMLRDGTIKDGDTLWFADLWFPGIEFLAYIRSMTGIKFKITGVLHAGTWDKMDFTFRVGMNAWAKGFERTVLTIADEIYLGSEFHKELIIKDVMTSSLIGPEQLKELANKMKVTGLFFEADQVRDTVGPNEMTKDENLVVFPHRLAPEKSPHIFDRIAKYFPDKTFTKTIEVTNTKVEYYKLAARAKYSISFQGQETFGYSTLEMMALGVIPLVYDGMSYQETVPKEYRWKNEKELIEKLTNGVEQVPVDLTQYRTTEVLKKMLGK